MSSNQSYSFLKPKQVDALKAGSKGDSIVLLPTGYGKSIIFHVLPFAINADASVIIVSPLNAIIMEQRDRFGPHCLVISSEFLSCLEKSQDETHGDKNSDVTRFLSGDFTYLIGHPEQLTNPTLRKILQSRVWEEKLKVVVIDEAHCVLSWGVSDFRPAFLQLKSLRAILPNAFFMALTATATPTALEELSKQLDLREPQIIQTTPDRYKINFYYYQFSCIIFTVNAKAHQALSL